MSDLAPIRESHFKENCLAWTALYHFLPSELIQELSRSIVNVVSDGQIALEHLFDQAVTSDGAGLGTWGLKPLEAGTPLAQYLQSRIRSFSWASDSGVGHEARVGDAPDAIDPTAVEDAVRFGQADFGLTDQLIDRMKFPQQSIRSLVAAFKLLRSSHALPGTEVVQSVVDGPCSDISMPLSAVAMKHLGDLCADADEWEKAHLFYHHAIRSLSDFKNPEWNQFAELFKCIAIQSSATALRTTKGAAIASAFLSNYLGASTFAEKPLLQLNASHDAFVAAALSSEKFSFSPDKRTSILLPPLLLKSLDLSSALESSAEENFTEAHRQYWQVLRRQIALGAASDSRATKVLYARSLFGELEQSIDRHDSGQSFWIAVRLILESGQMVLAQKWNWTEKFVQTYVGDQTVDGVIAHVTRNEGSRKERRNVAIELLGGWTKVLAPNQVDLAARMQGYLVDTVAEDTSNIFGQANARQRSLELLNQIGNDRPEFRASMAAAIANAVVSTTQKQVYWTEFAEALKTASTYIDVFSRDDLVKVVTAVLAFLDKLDPANNIWPVVQPSLDFLSSKEAKSLSDKAPELGRRIFLTVLRFGMNQETEHARLLFYLQDFDLDSINNEPLLGQLNQVVDDVRSKARTTNASDAINNIRALLIASTISRRDGVKEAIDALTQIVNSATTTHSSISFAYAYEALLLLAAKQAKIAKDISIEVDEFRAWLKPILDLLAPLWMKAKENPLIFASFSLPPATKPSSVIIHNWAYASINFALSMEELPSILSVLESAAEVPVLRDSIQMARATRLAASDWEQFNAATIRAEDRKTFYAALGQRLTQLRKIPEQARGSLLEALLDQCFKQGPHGLDLAVFLTAIEMGIMNFEARPDYQNYMKRLDNDRDLRLAIAPILHDVANAKQMSN
jgi:hypothetical protein